MRRKLLVLLQIVLPCLALDTAIAGTWAPVTAQPPRPPGLMLLLTDGTVMVQGEPYDQWMRLSPSRSGSYQDGSWSMLAPMRTARLYFASTVLPSGKVWVLGGEYAGPDNALALLNTGEIYDPLADRWTPVTNHPEPRFGDDPSILLPGGRVLAGSYDTRNTWIYDPARDNWSYAAGKVYPDRSSEEGWVRLPGGSILNYDLWWSIATGGQYAERYDPAANRWSSISPSDGTARGTIPALGGPPLGHEMGPAVRTRDRRGATEVLLLGANGHSALYDPRSNAWSAGPDVVGTLDGKPALFGADDAAAAVLPNGHVLFAADAAPTVGKLFSPPSALFDFDPETRTITTVPAIPLDPLLSRLPAYVTRMLVLPTGQVLIALAGRQLWIHTPDGTARAAARPRIRQAAYQGLGAFVLRGSQLSGQSAGSAYGDDAESDENYPILRFTSPAGEVYYARTSGWSSTGVGPNREESVDFTLHPQMPAGRYRMEVIAAGIASEAACLRITDDEVHAAPLRRPRWLTLGRCCEERDCGTEAADPASRSSR